MQSDQSFSLDMQNTTDTTISVDSYIHPKVVAYYITRLIQALLALLGNSLTIVAIVKTPALRTATNVLVGSLAVADLLSGAVAPITVCVAYLSNTDHWVPLCLTKEIVVLLFQAGNLYNVFYISVDRFIAVASPIRHMLLLDSRKILILTISTWTVSAVGVSLVITLSPPPDIYKNNPLCFYTEILPGWILNGIILPQFLLFSALTMVLYCRMSFLIWKSRVRVGNGQAKQILVGLKQHQSRQKKLTRTLSIVMVLYFVFTLPCVCLSSLVNKSVNDPVWLSDLYYVAVVMWYNSSMVNPLLYAWQAPGFRKAFKQILHLP